MAVDTTNPGTDPAAADAARSYGSVCAPHSGAILSRMITTPDAATMRLMATSLGVDTVVAEAAIDALRSRRVTCAVFSGKLASGKDTVAEEVGLRLHRDYHLAPAAIHRTSDPIRAELNQVIHLVGAAGSPTEATRTLRDRMDFPLDAAAHMATDLFPRIHAGPLTAETRTDANRHLLQYLADGGRRAVDPDYWVKQVFPRLLATLADGHSVMLSGGRYPNEIGPAHALGMVTVRLVISRAVQEARLTGRDGIAPNRTLLDDPNECALDDFAGFNLVVGNDDALDPTVAAVTREIAAHVQRLAG